MKQILMAVLLVSGIFCGRVVVAQGYYLEFNIMLTDNKGSGNMKTFSQDGNSRTEIVMSMGAQNPESKTPAMVAVTRKDAPDKLYMLNPDKKIFSEMDISQKEDNKDYDEADYEVTVIGKEKVNGYNTTHVKVTTKKTGRAQELWNSTEIPGYAEFVKIKTKYTGKENLNKALAAKGAQGFPVRAKISEGGNTAQIDLVKVEKRDNPSSLFSLDGYTKSSGAPGGQNVQEMMQKLQNMTPEERQKFIQQMKQQKAGGQ